MYLNHFGLREFPFGITPDTSFIYSADAHQEALNTLMIGLDTARASSRSRVKSAPARPCCAAAFWQR
jgi:type II secretory pathway predicted ATPase ExeA